MRGAPPAVPSPVLPWPEQDPLPPFGLAVLAGAVVGAAIDEGTATVLSLVELLHG